MKRLGVILLVLFLAGCSARAINQTEVPVSVVSEALQYSLAQLGKPYALGERGPDTFDCSGLVVWSYKQAFPELKLRIGGRVVPDATQDELWRYNIVVLKPEEVQPGDIVFITNDPNKVTHGGLFVRWLSGNEFEFINASSHFGEVVLDSWPLEGTKRGQWFAGAGRLQTVH